MHVLLDLDGTLTNPAEGIMACVRHAFTELGVDSPRDEELAAWIGPPLYDSFLKALNSPELAQAAVTQYRQRFSTVGLYENELYPEIPTGLAALCSAGYQLWVSTSKPQIFAQKIVDHFQLSQYFAGVYGSELNGDRAHKAALIAHILSAERILPETAVMIGDRHYDIVGALQNQVRAIGVTWGFGTSEELTEARAIALCSNPTDLPALVQTVIPPPNSDYSG